MLARALGITLLFGVWNEFSTVKAQSSSQVCEYDRDCSVAYVVTTCYWWGQCFQQVVIVNSKCRTQDTCVANSGTNPAWGTCTASCNPGGTRSRVNTCNRASSVGNTCTYSETEACNMNPCLGVDVDGSWGLWTSWAPATSCSVACCQGQLSEVRTRQCDSPPPSGGGMTCPGATGEIRAAPCGSDILDQCPVVCQAGDTTFRDTCRTCVNRYYTCVGGVAEETLCPVGQVYSESLNGCTTVNDCLDNP